MPKLEENIHKNYKKVKIKILKESYIIWMKNKIKL